jgi:hypothetical protein
LFINSYPKASEIEKIGNTALKKDKRGKYQDSREDIVQMARDYEAQGQPFTFWAGHGNDPFYIQIETINNFYISTCIKIRYILLIYNI